MPDFDARITAGSSLEVWTDARLNPYPEHLHKYWTVPVGGTVTIQASIPLFDAPVDGDLDGRLFYSKWAEWPYAGAPPGVSSPVGQSSTMTVSMLTQPGHYLLVVRRQQGGGIAIPFDVEV